MSATPTTPAEVADFLDTQGTPGQSVTDRTVATVKKMRMALGHDTAEDVFQLGRVAHLNRHLDRVAADPDRHLALADTGPVLRSTFDALSACDRALALLAAGDVATAAVVVAEVRDRLGMVQGSAA